MTETERARRRRLAERMWTQEPVEVRRRSCDGCKRSTLLRDLRCNDAFTGLYCRTCLPVPGATYPPTSDGTQ